MGVHKVSTVSTEICPQKTASENSEQNRAERDNKNVVPTGFEPVTLGANRQPLSHSSLVILA